MLKPAEDGTIDDMDEKGQAFILIVDDDSGNRKQWKAAIESTTFLVLQACSRDEALTYLGDFASRIDLLVTGVMRDGEGTQLAVEAFKLLPDLRIILVASAANPVGIQDHMAILLDPVSDAEMIGTARTLLSQ
jgi:CheY-like chemotaxis protein